MIRKKYILITLVALLFLPLASAKASLKDDIQETLIETIDAAGQGGNILDPRLVAVNIINVILSIFGIAFTILLIYGGWLWMTAAGNQDNVDQAKKVLQWAVIGITIVLISVSLSIFVSNSLIKATGGIVP